MQRKETPTESPAELNCRTYIRKAYEEKGFNEGAVNIILAARAESTYKQYDSELKKWNKFCKERNLNSVDCNIISIIEFLTEQFHLGAKYGSLNSMRSALSLLYGTDLSNNQDLSLFFKGLYKLKPTTPKYTHTWDINIVLKELESWHPTSSLSLKKLTRKLTMLLALRTAYRVQHLSLIKLANIKV